MKFYWEDKIIILPTDATNKLYIALAEKSLQSLDKISTYSIVYGAVVEYGKKALR